jgi:hypothetical protein
MIGKDELHVGAPNRGARPPSGNNQAHLKDKSSGAQSLSPALSPSSADPDRDPPDRDGLEKTMTEAQPISQDIRRAAAGSIDIERHRTAAPVLRGRARGAAR